MQAKDDLSQVPENTPFLTKEKLKSIEYRECKFDTLVLGKLDGLTHSDILYVIEIDGRRERRKSVKFLKISLTPYKIFHFF